ncbi:hypothetical protein RM844_21160 [Streptomyces sp. DSM 44915]|uniref:Integral membrane protein n=2 Tax=Streptomyces chisholmiae TaxID=3075540 RepID=A0ABU2JUY6_9ACTN|nr:hypothetical protein [Streptomyces sp. DSM 44915]MDT0268801.1 hypothetical protein [Streptomyces sp. DSM 44915]
MELLVHGVGGATPQDMLEDARTTRVTGDATASIHRRTDDLTDRPWDPERPVREAYSWSNLTSGNGTRALWLLLLPFMIVNVAHWMRPAGRTTVRANGRYDLLVRLLALSLTVLLTGGACAVALDLVAWQCAGAEACAREAGWIQPWATHSWWGQPGRRLLLGALVPVALLCLLWWLSHRTWSAYESASPPVRPRTDEDAAPLSLPGFWYGRVLVARLRAAHTTAGLLTVASALLVASGSHDRGPDGDPALATTGLLLVAGTVAGWLVLLVGQLRHGRSESERDERPEPPTARALPWGAMALLVLVLAHTAWHRPEWRSTGRLPAGSEAFPALVVVQGLLVVALAWAAYRLHRQARDAERGALHGLGGAAVALLACALGGVFTGGVAQRVADWLDPSAEPGEPGARLVGPPVMLSWEAAAIPPLLLVLLGLGVFGVIRVLRRRRVLAPTVRARYPEESCAPDTDRSRRIAGAIARAELTECAAPLVGWISGASLLLGVGAVAGTLTRKTPSEAADGTHPVLEAVADACQSLGSWLMGLGVVLLLALGRRAYRDAGARRTVGILWDVGTFWPRAAHPFAPPCYAERAVPDLSWRMGTWIDATGGRLVISGHSQGSVLAAAAVWQLDTATRSRIALLTHGSPLERLYGRWFPAYFGHGALHALHRDLPCWRNLWRPTDPIGGPVGVAKDSQLPVDRPALNDPQYYGRNLRSPLPEPILGHGDYAADPAFATERADLMHRLPLETRPPLPPQPTAPAHESPPTAG